MVTQKTNLNVDVKIRIFYKITLNFTYSKIVMDIMIWQNVIREWFITKLSLTLYIGSLNEGIPLFTKKLVLIAYK